MKRTKRPAKFRQLTVESLDGRVLPTATTWFPNANSLVADRVIVRFLHAPSVPAFADSLTPLGLGYYRVDLRAGVDAPEALRWFAGRADVAEAMPDSLITVARTTNDPSFPSQWSLSKTGATTAWNSFTGTGNTVVAVIDTGVDYFHADLAANIWRNFGEVAGNGKDDDGNGYIDDVTGYDFANNDNAPLDDDDHGTHVAGIIGAVGNNGLGVSGVNWSARIMPLKFLKGDGTGYTSDAVRAMNYAVANGAKIVNLSWGGGSYNSALASAIQNARTHGVVVVAAAGNNGTNSNSVAFYPASYSAANNNMVVVGASTSTDSAAGWSNYGSTAVTLFAPGSSILSLKPGNQYTTLSGTSMAAPFVSGALSLLWDKNPTWSYSQIITKLKASVDSVSSLATFSQTGGRISVAKLLDATSPPVVAPPPATPPPATPPLPSTRVGFASNGAAKPISDFGTSSMGLTINSDIAISDIDVSVNVSHKYVGDLILKLIGPDGTVVLLANRRGGSGDNYANALFTDEAATTISSATGPFSGSFKPEGSLAAFDGRNARGTWTLQVSDHAYYDTGLINSFTVYVTGTSTGSQAVRTLAFREPVRFAIVAPPVLRSETRSLLGYDVIQI